VVNDLPLIHLRCLPSVYPPVTTILPSTRHLSQNLLQHKLADSLYTFHYVRSALPPSSNILSLTYFLFYCVEKGC
jgi:hypothetical protein